MSFTRGELAEIQAGVRPLGAMRSITFDGGIESGKVSTKAALTTALTGNDNDIDYLADTAGLAGNDITIQYATGDKQVGSGIDVEVTGSTIKVNLATTATAESAQGLMTSDATAPDTGGTFVVGAKTYTARTALTEAYASAVLTSDATAPSDGDQVVVGATTYTFKTALTPTANEVLIGASAAAALDNLKSAVNLTGTPGTDYAAATAINAEATATTNTDTEQTFVAKTLGTAGNSIAKSETSTHLDWDGAGAFFTGGVAAIANEVLIGASAAAFLDNVKSAVNATAGVGTTYSTGTTANATVEATTNTNTTQLFSALTAGTAGNSIVFTENLTHTTMSGQGSGGGTLEGGTAAGDSTSTASDVITAIEASTAAAALVDVSLTSGNDGTGLVTTMAATNLSGGSDGKVLLFTVTGECLVSLRGYCETNLAGASATLVHGKTGTTNDLIPSFTATDLDAGGGIDSTGIVARGTALAKVPLKLYHDGESIFATVGTASVSAGVVHYIADYVAVSQNAGVELA
jgi:hypothetical protein